MALACPKIIFAIGFVAKFAQLPAIQNGIRMFIDRVYGKRPPVLQYDHDWFSGLLQFNEQFVLQPDRIDAVPITKMRCRKKASLDVNSSPPRNRTITSALCVSLTIFSDALLHDIRRP